MSKLPIKTKTADEQVNPLFSNATGD